MLPPAEKSVRPVPAVNIEAPEPIVIAAAVFVPDVIVEKDGVAGVIPPAVALMIMAKATGVPVTVAEISTRSPAITLKLCEVSLQLVALVPEMVQVKVCGVVFLSQVKTIELPEPSGALICT